MISTFLQVVLSFVLFTASTVYAEKHTVRFQNHCGHGTPTLIQGAETLSTGQDYTSEGVLSSAIAYLQTGDCGFNGENCAIVEMTLGNSHCIGCGSSVDISLIPSHALNVETSFSFFGGCDGSGATCATKDCKTAFFVPDDNQVQVSCQSNDVGLLITFCGSSASAPQQKPPAVKPTSALASSPAPTASHTHDTSIATSSAPPVINVGDSKPVNVVHSSSIATTPSVTTSSVATSTSTPPKCRRSMRRRAEKESRALYEAHRRHHARVQAGHGRSF
ncbi:unnamed protein product [Somion occarium]|uniref:Glycopeptide n=1 Tax=Somion occarium TaxID=3059160 RepID=A0ABP1DH00_9APHY